MQEKDQEEEDHKMGCCVYCIYYLALFFVHWFGSEAFDQNGDGTFDPSDVEVWLQSIGILHKEFKRPPHLHKDFARSASSLGHTGSSSSAQKTAYPPQEVEHTRRESKSGGTSQAPLSHILGGGASRAVTSMKVAIEGGTSQAVTELKDVVRTEFVLDQNGDGKVDLMDMLESKVVGQSQENAIWDKVHKKHKIPFFCIFQCSTCMLLWLAFTIKAMSDGSDNEEQGLDSIMPGWSRLRLFGADCADERSEVWRWVLYQFTHIGVGHVGMNCFLTIMLGLPLEMIEGCRRMFLMFNFGVFGGAIMYMAADAHSAVVGMSGGCYALMGIQFADLLMNWNQKRFRKPALLFLLLLAAIDIGSYAMTMGKETSVSAHAGGFGAGLVIGIVIGKNYQVKCLEKVMRWNSFLCGVAFVVFTLVWVYTHPAAQNWFEASAGVSPWCWTQQVYDPKYDAAWFCVRCADQDCIDFWTSHDNHKDVSYVVCTEMAGGPHEPWSYEPDTWQEAQAITTTR